MPNINITTTEQERQAVIEAVKKTKGKTTPLSELSKLAGLPVSRARYALEDLIIEGKVAKIREKYFNNRYVRYSYKVTDS